MTCPNKIEANKYYLCTKVKESSVTKDDWSSMSYSEYMKRKFDFTIGTIYWALYDNFLIDNGGSLVKVEGDDLSYFENFNFEIDKEVKAVLDKLKNYKVKIIAVNLRPRQIVCGCPYYFCSIKFVSPKDNFLYQTNRIYGFNQMEILASSFKKMKKTIVCQSEVTLAVFGSYRQP